MLGRPGKPRSRPEGRSGNPRRFMQIHTDSCRFMQIRSESVAGLGRKWCFRLASVRKWGFHLHVLANSHRFRPNPQRILAESCKCGSNPRRCSGRFLKIRAESAARCGWKRDVSMRFSLRKRRFHESSVADSCRLMRTHVDSYTDSYRFIQIRAH